MPENSAAPTFDEMPETFVSDTAISRDVSRAVKAGKLRKLVSRLYTRNLDGPARGGGRAQPLEHRRRLLPRRADRTALENAPAQDGSVCLITERGKDIKLPGLTLRPRRGKGSLATDRPFIGGLNLAPNAPPTWRSARTGAGNVRWSHT